MIEDLYNPLETYRDRYAGEFLASTTKLFEDLLKRSGVDEAKNARLVAQVVELERKGKSRGRRSTFMGCLMVPLIGWVVLSGFSLFYCEDMETLAVVLIVFIAPALVPLYFLWRYRRKLKQERAEIEQTIAGLKKQAWQQMEPLNRLYHWDITPGLIRQTLPWLQLDPYCGELRYRQLVEYYGWQPKDAETRAMISTQSGSIQGNPFVLMTFRSQTWGTKIYTGSETIHWTERVRNSKGNYITVHRSEVLTASVEKPIPVYRDENVLVYGNQAAPQLCFNRVKSGLAEDSFLNKFRMRRKIAKLEAFSRVLTDDSEYTMMSNREFEALFETMDRNHEVEYRVLFTPIAQRQMMALLKDNSVGYGDDFSFSKRQKINLIIPEHLQQFDLSTDPKLFKDWDLRRAREYFVKRNTEYFRHFYFTLAPILVIPTYLQTSPETITGVDDRQAMATNPLSSWEHESLAYCCGERHFKAENCVTQCILKSEIHKVDPTQESVKVTAYGFRTIPRKTVESVYGGDGRYHDVTVLWDEYREVQRTSQMEVYRQAQLLPNHAVRCRSSLFVVPPSQKEAS